MTIHIILVMVFVRLIVATSVVKVCGSGMGRWREEISFYWAEISGEDGAPIL